MFCEQCGKQLKDNDNFCTGCGHKVTRFEAPVVPDEPTKADVSAEATAAEAPANETVVADTVTEVAATQTVVAEPIVTAETEKPVQPPLMYKPKSNKGLAVTISICAALLVILAAVLVFVIVNKDISPDDEADSGYSQTEDKTDDKTEEKPKHEKKKPKVNQIDNYVIEEAIANGVSYTDFGIYMCNLTNGYEYEYNADSAMPASAMCQVVILDTLSREARKHSIDIDTEAVYFDYMPNGKEAPDSKNEDGAYVTLRDCIEDVAVYGDNNKSNHIIDYIGYLNNRTGFDVIRSTLDDNNYVNTEINRKVFVDSRYIDTTASPNVTTAKEISKIYDNLINRSYFGTPTYMKNIFKSISNEGQAIGLKKYVPEMYDMCSVNALNSQSTNDVAIISNGSVDVLVAILSCTDEGKTNIEDNDVRESVQSKIIEHILETQFK